MPLQNRVTPDGEIVATPERGLMMGNRGGALHGDDRRLRNRRWVSKQWICCRLEFKDRHRHVMTPGRYTELFFLDEATALAAGHRPCFECRRQEALRFAELWSVAYGLRQRASAGALDDRLHAERLDRRGRKLVSSMQLDELPSGTFIRHENSPHIVLDGELRRWSPGGYGEATRLTFSRPVDVLTPSSIVAVLAAGYLPMLHPSAGRSA